MSTKIKSRNDAIAADQAMVDGITKHEGSLPPTMSVGSQTMTPAGVIAFFQGLVASGKSVVSAEAAHTAAVKADRDKRAQTKAMATAARRLIVAMFMQSPDTLGDFGLHAPKVTVRTTEEKAQAAARARETRKTLGTKGKLQKKAALEAAAAPAAAPATPAAAPAVKPAS
jgi:hypothetical protein